MLDTCGSQTVVSGHGINFLMKLVNSVPTLLWVLQFQLFV